MRAGRIKRRGVVRPGAGAGSRAAQTGCIRESTTNDILDAVIIRSLLPVHLRNIALVAIVHRDFQAAGTRPVWWISIPDRLLPPCTGSTNALVIRCEEIRIDFLVELEIQNISQWCSRSDVRECPVRIPFERLRKEAARIGAAVGRNGELQRTAARMRIRGVDLWKDTLSILNYGASIAGAGAGRPEKVVRLSSESGITDRACRPIVKKSIAVVEAEAAKVARLTALLDK